MPSKKMRNKIAGYIARLVRMQKEEAVKAAKKKEMAASQVPQYEIQSQSE